MQAKLFRFADDASNKMHDSSIFYEYFEKCFIVLSIGAVHSPQIYHLQLS